MRFLLTALLFCVSSAWANPMLTIQNPQYKGGKTWLRWGTHTKGTNVWGGFESNSFWTVGSGDVGAVSTNPVFEGIRSMYIYTTNGSRADLTRNETNRWARYNPTASAFEGRNVTGFEFDFYPQTTVTQLFLQLSIGATSFANEANWETLANQLGVWWTPNSWNKYYVDDLFGTWVKGGSQNFNTFILSQRLTVRNSDGFGTNWWDGGSWYTGGRRKAIVIVGFDDGYSANWTNAYPYAKFYNVPCTYYTTSGYITNFGGTVDGYPPNTTNQLNDFYDAGWEIANHTHTHQNLANTNEATVLSEITLCANWIKNNGWIRNNAWRNVAYPFGGHNATVKSAMTNFNMRSGRTIENTWDIRPHHCDFGDYHADLDQFDLDTYQVIGNTTVIADLTNRVDKAIGDGACIEFLYHHVIPITASSLRTPTNLFSGLIDHIVLRRSQGMIEVMTAANYHSLRRLPNWKKTAGLAN